MTFPCVQLTAALRVINARGRKLSQKLTDTWPLSRSLRPPVVTVSDTKAFIQKTGQMSQDIKTRLPVC